MSNLTPQREAFAAALAQGMTQAAAYRVAYPRSKDWTDKTVWSKASALAADDLVSARVAALVGQAAAKNEVTVERIVREFARLAFSNPRAMFNEDGTPKKITDLTDDEAAAVAGFEVVSVGNAAMGEGQVVKVKLADKRAALADLGRHMKMFIDRVEVSGTIGIADTLRQAREKRRGGGGEA